ncbi:ABC transporter permease [Microscilla marina]|uniref:Binding-protein-dependent transport systems inner membrane component n=1 Tax=Microscilla marina ATCC 23134 TaxID=313606 RepID=A1ZRY7_MICM2|nr:ABC transporter permease subunit [Microscilla marina]EAY26875.1 binding-protein-dependent transport systems inner membrane component [Microscilla marina ATCC 23134]
MGMTRRQILHKVELPLAMPVIFAGIRTAVAINVRVATLGVLIDAGGLGKFIFRSISLVDPIMMMAGAVPAALLALFFDFGLVFLQKHFKITPYFSWIAGMALLFIASYSVVIYASSAKLMGSLSLSNALTVTKTWLVLMGLPTLR